MSPQRIVSIQQSVRIFKFFGGPLDTWIETKDGDDPGNKEALITVLRGDGANFDDTVTISIAKAS